MQWWHPETFAQKKANLKRRAQIIKQCRAYFDQHDFDEVQTPVLQVMASPDTHIHAFETQQLGRNLKPTLRLGLHTSPEIAMKKLLVAGQGVGLDRIYQICPVFRNGEEGRLHSPEFTMLEWYRVGADYTAMMDDCEALIQSMGMFTDAPFERLSVADAFARYVQIDIHGDIHAQAIKAGIRVIDSDGFEDVFHAIMAEKIEPFLGFDVPTILYDYPVCMAALARRGADDRIAERFELYINGVEIANAYSELCDPVEQNARLRDDLAAKREIYGVDAPMDDDFIAALECGMPESAGCALGLDRLVMIACDTQDIDDVLWAGKP